MKTSLNVRDAKYDILRLDNQLCFALYAATHAFTKAYWRKLQPLGLTYPQFLVLVVLWEQDQLTIGEIGERLLLDSGTLTPLVKRLETQGYVRRQRATSDQRQVRVSMTKAGLNLRDSTLAAQQDVRCRLEMTEDQIRALRAQIMGLISRLGPECAKEAAK